MFSRYAGEQVPTVPSGYLESAQAQAAMYANIGQTIGKALGGHKENELKSAEIAQSKRKNDLYEDKLNKEKDTSFFGDIEKISGLLGKSLEQIDGQIGTLDKEIRGGKLDTAGMADAQARIKALTEQRGSVAGKMNSLSERAYDYVTQGTGKGSPDGKPKPGSNMMQPQGFINGIPIGSPVSERGAGGTVDMLNQPFDLMKPRADNRGFVPTNYLTDGNPMGSSGTGVVSTYTTNGIGGAQKKVVVQDGRVHSVIDSSGKSTQLSGFLPEQSISAAEEYAGIVAGEQASYASNTPEVDHTKEPNIPTGEPALAEQAQPGPLRQTMYRIPVEGLDAYPNSGNETGKVHGTIEFEGGKPKMKFNWDLLDPTKLGERGVESPKQSLRMLSVMNYILQSGQEQEVTDLSDAEMATARKLFQTNNNSNEIYRIAQAYALASRDTTDNPDGTPKDSPESNRFGLRFKDEYRMWPTEFLIKGEVNNMKIISPSTKILNEENVAGVLGKVREAETELITISGRPESLEKEDPTIKQITALKKKRDFEMETFEGPGNKKQKDDAMKKIKALDDELKFWEAESRIYQSRVQQWQDSIKAAQAKIEAAKGPITTQKTLTEIQGNEQGQARIASQVIRNFFPSTGKDIFKYGGWMPSRIKEITGYGEVIKDKLGRSYQWSMSPKETLESLYRNGQWKDIETIGALMPTDDQFKALDQAHKSAIGAVVPLVKLQRLNDTLVKTWRKPGGVVQTQLAKLTDNQLAEAETMRAAIIKDIRVALVGPGNPSNYEQEILRTIVPDPKEFFSFPERNRIRIKALTLLVVLNHAANMKYNGLDKQDDSIYAWYNQFYGEALGDTIDAKTFNNIFEDYSKASNNFKANEAKGREVDSATSFGEMLIKRLEEAEAAKDRAKK
jgi:hypothetical protein